MKFSAHQYAQALHDLAQDLPEKQHPALVRSFVDLLRRQRDRRLLSRILVAYEEYQLAYAKQYALTVTVAHRDHAEGIEGLLRKAMDGSAKPTLHEDADLLGGAILRLGDTLVDGSLRSQLLRLRRQLTTSVLDSQRS